MYIKKCSILFCIMMLLFQSGCDIKTTKQNKELESIKEIKIGFTVYRRDDTFIAMIVSGL